MSKIKAGGGGRGTIRKYYQEVVRTEYGWSIGYTGGHRSRWGRWAGESYIEPGDEGSLIPS